MPECPVCGESLSRSTLRPHADNPAVEIRRCGACNNVVEYLQVVHQTVFHEDWKPAPRARTFTRK